MDDLALWGMLFVMISSDLPELIELSDRIGIMRKGKMVKIIKGSEATEESLLKYSTGV